MAADVDLLIKLFDTLKDSSKDTQQMCQSMLTNQANIGNYIRNLPLGELKDLVKDHAQHSEADIETCTETVETKSDSILTEVQEIKGKVKTMITVVIVAFALFTIAGLIGVISYESQKSKPDTYIDDFYNEDDTEIKHEELKKEIIDSIKEELKRYEEKRNK